MADILLLLGAYVIGTATGIAFMLWRSYRKSLAVETITGPVAAYDEEVQRRLADAQLMYTMASKHSSLQTAMAAADKPIHIKAAKIIAEASKPRAKKKSPAKKPAAKPRAKGRAVK